VRERIEVRRREMKGREDRAGRTSELRGGSGGRSRHGRVS
jgi:hypothetical protein